MTSAVTKALKELIALDYDAIEAYEAAIERIENAEVNAKLAEFKQDHVQHTRNLGELVRAQGEEPPTGPDMKRILTEGKVKIAGLGGDNAVLKAMSINEKVTNEAYDKALKLDGLDAATEQALRANLADEQRHKAWIDARID